jgi:hypothetical protein
MMWVIPWKSQASKIWSNVASFFFFFMYSKLIHRIGTIGLVFVMSTVACSPNGKRSKTFHRCPFPFCCYSTWSRAALQPPLCPSCCSWQANSYQPLPELSCPMHHHSEWEDSDHVEESWRGSPSLPKDWALASLQAAWSEKRGPGLNRGTGCLTVLAPPLVTLTLHDLKKRMKEFGWDHTKNAKKEDMRTMWRIND